MNAWFKQNLPLVIALVIAVVIVGGAFFLRVGHGTPDDLAFTVVSAPDRDTMRSGFAGESDKDSDKDGLKDWEEVLHGTSIVNADSDGDSTKDGDEVAAGRDPLVPGPDDVVNDSSGQSFAQYRASESLSKTEGLGRELFSTYVSLKENGGIGTEYQNQAVAALAERYVIETVAYSYVAEDLTYAAVQDATSVTAYRDGVLKAIKPAESITQYELATYAYLLDTGNPAFAKALSGNALLYRTIAQNLQKVPVPLLLSANHLALMNAVMDLAAGLDEMVANYNDPIAALIATSAFADADERIRNAITDFYELTEVQ